MRGRHLACAAHFGEADSETGFGELPCRFAASEAAADDVDVMILGHAPLLANAARWGKLVRMREAL